MTRTDRESVAQSLAVAGYRYPWLLKVEMFHLLGLVGEGEDSTEQESHREASRRGTAPGSTCMGPEAEALDHTQYSFVESLPVQVARKFAREQIREQRDHQWSRYPVESFCRVSWRAALGSWRP